MKINILVVAGIILTSTVARGDDIVMKIVTRNPFNIAQPLQIHEPLPFGLRTNDVVGLDGLILVSNPDGRLAVDKFIQLKPGLAIIFYVRFRDVWRIPDERFADVKRSHELALGRMHAIQKARETDPSLRNVDLPLDQFVTDLTNSWAQLEAERTNVSYRGGPELNSYIKEAETLRRNFEEHEEIIDLIVPILSEKKKSEQDVLIELRIAIDRYRYQSLQKTVFSVVDDKKVATPKVVVGDEFPMMNSLDQNIIRSSVIVFCTMENHGDSRKYKVDEVMLLRPNISWTYQKGDYLPPPQVHKINREKPVTRNPEGAVLFYVGRTPTLYGISFVYDGKTTMWGKIPLEELRNKINSANH